MRGKVSPKLNEFLALVNEQIALAKQENVIFSPQMVRENLDKLAAFTSVSPEIAFVEQRELVIDKQTVSTRIYSPAPNEKLPVLIYFHGGGHMCGSAKLYDPMCRKMAIAGQCVVINVDYRLAPEFPYPAGLTDCKTVLRHYQQLLTNVSYNHQVFIGGDSAGGAICTSLAMQSLSDDTLKIDGQILIYPSVDYTMSRESVQSNGSGFLLESTKVAWYFDHYFQNNENRELASPLYGPINDKLPQTLVITVGCDPLRDEGNEYANALMLAGVKVVHHQFDDMIHAFMNIEDLVPEECQHLYQLIGTFMRS
ncbi:alpha/beta hydrolase [Colwelliaceae bacterium 6471]